MNFLPGGNPLPTEPPGHPGGARILRGQLPRLHGQEPSWTYLFSSFTASLLVSSRLHWPRCLLSSVVTESTATSSMVSAFMTLFGNLPNFVLTPLSSVPLPCPLSSVLCPLSSVLCPLSSVLCPLSPALTAPTQVLELCENGELAKFLRDSNRVFSEQEARTIFEQVGWHPDPILDGRPAFCQKSERAQKNDVFLRTTANYIL